MIYLLESNYSSIRKILLKVLAQHQFYNYQKTLKLKEAKKSNNIS